MERKVILDRRACNGEFKDIDAVHKKYMMGHFYSGDTGPVPEPLNGGYSAYHLSLPVSSFSSVVKR